METLSSSPSSTSSSSSIAPIIQQWLDRFPNLVYINLPYLIPPPTAIGPFLSADKTVRLNCLHFASTDEECQKLFPGLTIRSIDSWLEQNNVQRSLKPLNQVSIRRELLDNPFVFTQREEIMREFTRTIISTFFQGDRTIPDYGSEVSKVVLINNDARFHYLHPDQPQSLLSHTIYYLSWLEKLLLTFILLCCPDLFSACVAMDHSLAFPLERNQVGIPASLNAFMKNHMIYTKSICPLVLNRRNLFDRRPLEERDTLHLCEGVIHYITGMQQRGNWRTLQGLPDYRCDIQFQTKDELAEMARVHSHLVVILMYLFVNRYESHKSNSIFSYFNLCRWMLHSYSPRSLIPSIDSPDIQNWFKADPVRMKGLHNFLSAVNSVTTLINHNHWTVQNISCSKTDLERLTFVIPRGLIFKEDLDSYYYRYQTDSPSSWLFTNSTKNCFHTMTIIPSEKGILRSYMHHYLTLTDIFTASYLRDLSEQTNLSSLFIALIPMKSVLLRNVIRRCCSALLVPNARFILSSRLIDTIVYEEKIYLTQVEDSKEHVEVKVPEVTGDTLALMVMPNAELYQCQLLLMAIYINQFRGEPSLSLPDMVQAGIIQALLPLVGIENEENDIRKILLFLKVLLCPLDQADLLQSSVWNGNNVERWWATFKTEIQYGLKSQSGRRRSMFYDLPCFIQIMNEIRMGFLLLMFSDAYYDLNSVIKFKNILSQVTQKKREDSYGLFIKQIQIQRREEKHHVLFESDRSRLSGMTKDNAIQQLDLLLGDIDSLDEDDCKSEYFYTALLLFRPFLPGVSNAYYNRLFRDSELSFTANGFLNRNEPTPSEVDLPVKGTFALSCWLHLCTYDPDPHNPNYGLDNLKYREAYETDYIALIRTCRRENRSILWRDPSWFQTHLIWPLDEHTTTIIHPLIQSLLAETRLTYYNIHSKNLSNSHIYEYIHKHYYSPPEKPKNHEIEKEEEKESHVSNHYSSSSSSVRRKRKSSYRDHKSKKHDHKISVTPRLVASSSPSPSPLSSPLVSESISARLGALNDKIDGRLGSNVEWI